MNKTIGQKISPILEEIEDTLWEFEAFQAGHLPKFPVSGLRAATKIFSTVLMEKMWEMQEAEKMPQKEREKMAVYAGQQIRKLTKELTNIDTIELYK